MFENYLSCYRTCYRKCFNQNERLYVRLKNESDNFLYFGIEYELDGKFKTKYTPIIPPGKTDQLNFTQGAKNIFFTVFNCHEKPPTIVCHFGISNSIPSCYRVIGGQYIAFQCIKVNC